ncbi:MAG TPA: metallophosphoesterase [Clostridiaceae bacterium]|nr:metallophosphoesterase [Clostridiaceae bacterium]
MLSPKIVNSLKVAIITDLHSCYYGKNQNDLIQAIDSNQPDLVFFVGDIVDDRMPEDNAYITLEKLSLKYPAYYVTGNHEIYTGNFEDIKQRINGFGITVLSGEQSEIEINNNKLIIKGLDDPEVGNMEYNRQLKEIHDGDENIFTFLLAHRPERNYDYDQIRHDLVLSGHAHGGQWRIPKILPGIIAPNQGFFPHYTSGFYQLKHSTLLVSRGLSKENIFLPRFYNPPEVIILELAAR